MILQADFWPRLTGGILLMLVGATVLAAGVPPDQLVKTTAEEVLTILRGDPDVANGDTRKILDVVEAKVLAHFDFERMTRLAVGKNWRTASAAQKHSLTNSFRTLLVRTYAVALTQFRNRKVEYRPLEEALSGPEVMVHTAVETASGKPLNIDYRMVAANDDWKVYDVLVDGVSLVVNYRSMFDSTVEQSGLDGLVSLLEAKNAQAASGTVTQ